MEIYRRFFDARSLVSAPVRARVNGNRCWLAQVPTLMLIETAIFRAVLRGGPSGITRSFEFGKADDFYCVITRGVGAEDTVALFSSQEHARQEYVDAPTKRAIGSGLGRASATSSDTGKTSSYLISALPDVFLLAVVLS